MTTLPKPIYFAGPDAPAEQDLYRCVRCGLCLQSCPTFVETGLETESPRGRLALMRAVLQERAGLGEGLIEHLDLCLQCRACEAVCPSGVPYGRVMEAARTQIATRTKRGLRERLVRWATFDVLFKHMSLLRASFWVLKVYQRSGLQWIVRESRVLKPFGGLDQLERQLLPLPKFFSIPRSQVVAATGTKKHRVAMLSGCVMPLAFGSVNAATVRVLSRNGCEVVLPRVQGCCGALHTHSGEREGARDLARRNIDAFLAADVEAIVVNSAGCGSTMKEYRELLRDDPVYAKKAERFSALVKDVHEYLASLPLVAPAGRVEARVTYQDSCHLVYAQRVKDAPRKVLAAIPGLEFVEMENADMCCGAAGVYNITHRDLSNQILAHKMEHAAAVKPQVIATANPGCMLQLRMGAEGAGLDVRVAHVIELLDEAYGPS